MCPVKFQSITFALCLVLGIGTSLGQTTIEMGDRLVQEGKLGEALAAYDEVKQAHPDQLEPYLRSAQVLLREERPKDAGAELNEALRMRPATAEQARELAGALSGAGNPVLASVVLEEWQTQGDLDLEGWWLLSDLYYRQRQFDRALSALDEHRKLAGGSSEESNLRRAMILLEKGSLEESMSAFEEVASQDPRSGDALHGLSKVCLFGNNPEAALKMSEAAVGLDATNGIYLYQLGVVLKALGRNQEAVQRLEEAESRGADAFGVTFDLGDAYRKAGEMEKAQQALARYQSILEEKRKNQEVLQLANQGDEELQRGDRAAAQETFRRLVQIDPDNWDGHNRLAKIALSANGFDQAMIHVERMLQVDPESSEAHFLAALCRNGKSDRKQALYHAEESKRLRPGNAALRNLLGNLYFAAGDWTRSKEEYQAASSLEPDNPVFRANLESAVRRVGQ